MRDLLFRNLTSQDRKRRVIATSEINDKEGIHSIIHRHFACIIKEVGPNHAYKPQPYLYILKERNQKELREKFFCRIKGSVYLVRHGRLFLVLFMHSLKINLTATQPDLIEPHLG